VLWSQMPVDEPSHQERPEEGASTPALLDSLSLTCSITCSRPNLTFLPSLDESDAADIPILIPTARSCTFGGSAQGDRHHRVTRFIKPGDGRHAGAEGDPRIALHCPSWGSPSTIRDADRRWRHMGSSATISATTRWVRSSRGNDDVRRDWRPTSCWRPAVVAGALTAVLRSALRARARLESIIGVRDTACTPGGRRSC